AELFRAIRRKGLLIIATTLAVAIPSSVWILSQPPLYEGKVEILVEPPNQRSESSIVVAGRGLGGPRSNLDYDSQIRVLKSPVILTPIVQSIQSKYPEVLLYPPADKKDKKKEGLTEAIKIKRGAKDTRILEVSYKSESKEKVLFVLRHTIRGYLQYQKKEHIDSLSRQIDFTEREIKKARAEVAKWDFELEKFQKSRGVMTPNLQGNAFQAQLAFIQGEREKVKVELEGLRKLSRELQKKIQLTPQQVDIVTLLNRQPYYLQLISRLRETETQLALETVKLGSEHPAVKELSLRRDQLVSLLQIETDKILKNPPENLSLDFLVSIPQNRLEAVQQFFDVNNQIQVLQAKDRGLAEALEKLNRNTSDFSTTNREYSQLLRESQIANQKLTRLLTSMENLRFQLYTALFPWQVLTPIDENIIKDASKKNIKLAVVIISSVFVSLFIGLLLEFSDKRFRSLEEIKNTIRLPLLGTCPYNKNLAVLFPGNHKKARKKGLISPQTL
ncbi:MAG: Wzz/FepE/Etk N-terminal domain-containing protein, partial [Geminocystis sp.]|nr:Wzz/FepE/Etk N-terminal domain-containing protein [Geminocystis sp.]HIK37053.1 capsular biosynthesis protein [Geminocystis sp. M7585_C2015_104]